MFVVPPAVPRVGAGTKETFPGPGEGPTVQPPVAHKLNPQGIIPVTLRGRITTLPRDSCVYHMPFLEYDWHGIGARWT